MKLATILLVVMLVYFGAHIIWGTVYCHNYVCVGEGWEDLDAVEARQLKELNAR